MSCDRFADFDFRAYLDAPEDPRWREFRAHLASCADCADEVAALRALKEAFAGATPPGRRSAEPDAHPTPEELAALSGAGTVADPARMRAIALHVARCGSCGDELGLLMRHASGSRAAALPPGGVAAPWWRRASRWAARPAVAYALALALLSVEAVRWLGPDEPPGATEPVREPGPGPGAKRLPSSPVLRLEPGLVPKVSLQEARNGLELSLPSLGAGGAELRVTGPGRKLVLERRIQKPSAARVPLALPPDWLDAGSYDVEVRPQGGDGARAVRLGFEVEAR